jgi:hypothetical protein
MTTLYVYIIAIIVTFGLLMIHNTCDYILTSWKIQSLIKEKKENLSKNTETPLAQPENPLPIQNRYVALQWMKD